MLDEWSLMNYRGDRVLEKQGGGDMQKRDKLGQAGCVTIYFTYRSFIKTKTSFCDFNQKTH